MFKVDIKGSVIICSNLLLNNLYTSYSNVNVNSIVIGVVMTG